MAKRKANSQRQREGTRNKRIADERALVRGVIENPPTSYFLNAWKASGTGTGCSRRKLSAIANSIEKQASALEACQLGPLNLLIVKDGAPADVDTIEIVPLLRATVEELRKIEASFSRRGADSRSRLALQIAWRVETALGNPHTATVAKYLGISTASLEKLRKRRPFSRPQHLYGAEAVAEMKRFGMTAG